MSDPALVEALTAIADAIHYLGNGVSQVAGALLIGLLANAILRD